ncbi:MAG TPA: M14 family zinc carboxypeptidase [Thermoanaerobaculia bacterium]|nr:M14 family zinc carboxypeptidase [Thermoanaerobaculia bacterium]
MRRSAFAVLLLMTCVVAPLAAQTRVPAALKPSLDQPIDADATARIRKYTTAPEFNSVLTDYLPASSSVPSPSAVLGDVAGAPGILPYVAEVNRYFRMLAAASPRVRVISIGLSEEGRERIAVAVSSEKNLEHQKENDARLAQLADPRLLKLDDARAEGLITASVPIYYITGTIHSPETGAPTALMELAYRLAVDESPYVRAIRENVITLITPVVEVDGRDRMVDVYRWHLAHPKANMPFLSYWGHYVAHDNNRDAMGLTLSLSRQVLDTYLGWHAQVLHDLHESVPFLYDNTVGDGPYNAWVDPLLTNEWQLFGWTNVAEMGKLGMPGVFTHGDFDTWSPGYLMFLAAMHNGVSRLYETFGNRGADTETRELQPDQASRTWYRQDPPYQTVSWSQRNNNNYEETGLLVSLAFVAENRELLLRNFWQKSKRSITKPEKEGPAAYVLPADDRRPGAQAELLRVLQLQHVEISRADRSFTVAVENTIKPKGDVKDTAKDKAQDKAPTTRTFPAGSYVVRMDQPYSRSADALLDRQYWSPDDPQKRPYDDTGWCFPALFDTEAVRITDPKALAAAMSRVEAPVRSSGGVTGGGPVFVVAQRGDDAMFSLRYALGDATVEAAAEPFKAGGHDYSRGTWLVRGITKEALDHAAAETGVTVDAIAAAPKVATRPIAKPRIALLHTWISTQTEGWWRQRLDLLKIPYRYISTQDVAADPNLSASYDVILFPPVGVGDPLRIVNGLPLWGEPMPWKTTPETPNLGKIASTDDQRPGLGFAGLDHLRQFVEQGGLLVAVEDTAQLMVSTGMAPGVRVTRARNLKVVGSVLDARFPDATSPVVDGLGDRLSVYSADGLSFELSNSAAGGWAGEEDDRPTGRGGPKDTDVPQGRTPQPPRPARAKVERWEARPLEIEELRNNPSVIPEALRPRTLVRFGDAGDLLVSGLLEHGDELARRAAVVEVPVGKGHLLLFAINPIWRGSTIGSHPLVWNAILQHQALAPGAASSGQPAAR